ncbi:hypothetical protein PSV3_00158 [Septimatrevirus PSV32]|uniref:Uncharacterized protein n=2 Tax=Pseudomonas phage PSV3 TaxID=3003632 RepID=A0AAE9W084_9CAUD|nr:hypothetical protein PM407_gp52 [Pseudomonas phage PSV3]YP_010598225.1 hypothetical protein PM409_gp55 [Pseudomonas phage PSV3]WBF76860.1 hypothetical protein PSV3_00158 [Pseudomonas phage PSV3]WBF77032.1 hypothetical protein PSV3_00331 [Pseudomonas phage PSV3]
MQMSQLKPASQLARRYGVKSVVFGAPGSGKTPLINTAPRPVLLVTEPGMLSMRGSNVPAWEAYSPALIVEFFEWFMKSREAANFDTLGIDSISNIARSRMGSVFARAYRRILRMVYEIARSCEFRYVGY